MINCANMTSISYTRPLNIGRHPVTCPVIAGSLFTYCWKTIPYSWTNARQCKTKSRICSPDPASYKPGDLWGIHQFFFIFNRRKYRAHCCSKQFSHLIIINFIMFIVLCIWYNGVGASMHLTFPFPKTHRKYPING